jgi:hypothetical protein
MPHTRPSPLRVGQVLEIAFPPFTPRIIFLSDRELTVQIVSGHNAGFTDTVEYEVVEIRRVRVAVRIRPRRRRRFDRWGTDATDQLSDRRSRPAT